MPDPTNIIPVLPFITAVQTRLGGLPTTTPPTKGYVSEPVDVPALGRQGEVQRYWVLHPFPGTPGTELDLADTVVDSDWTFQITAAAGFALDAVAIAEDIHALLYRWIPTVAGYVCGPIKPPPGYDPGPPRKDESIKPHRFFTPLQYRTTITRANA